MFRIRDSIFSRFDKKQRDRGFKYLQNVENLQYRDISISLGFFYYLFVTCFIHVRDYLVKIGHFTKCQYTNDNILSFACHHI